MNFLEILVMMMRNVGGTPTVNKYISQTRVCVGGLYRRRIICSCSPSTDGNIPEMLYQKRKYSEKEETCNRPLAFSLCHVHYLF